MTPRLAATILLVPLWLYGQAYYPQKIVTFHTQKDGQAGGSPHKAVPVPPRCPIRTIRAVHQSEDGAVWVAGSAAVARFTEERGWEYFAGRRYLPEGEVRELVVERPDRVWIRTDTAWSRIEFRPMTLEAKAEEFEKRIDLRHNRYGLVADSELTTPGDLASNRMIPSDNDGLWTAIYAGAECFRYAVTGSERARANARRSVEAMMRLEEITGQPGFPARSFIRKGDFRHRGGIWRDTQDGRFEWKADTSSDEIVGHFLAYTLYYDLVAGEDEKPRLRAIADRIMTRIMEDGYNLVDRVTGKPTTWGKWSVEYFDDPRTGSDVALNSAEILSHLLVAHHMTGKAKYLEAYRRLIDDHGYARNTARYLELRREINYSDEELAMLSFYPLFLYEKDAGLRRIYGQGLDQWWQNIQREKNPLWIFIYQQATGRRAHTADAVWSLARYPMDLITWTVNNAPRADITWTSEPDRFKRAQIRELLPPDERRVHRWNTNVFSPDGGNGGRGEDDGAAFLLPYWMGRYHGFLSQP
ncbi:MAG: hypothetical protein HY238_15340 [Acidobacteria bacterium]|nr:hypothetical protein [Acidobacteriota bacterium]